MKICCIGEGEQPRFTNSGRAYCPECHRPVDYKTVVWYSLTLRREVTEVMAKRHRSDGISSGTRLGIPNEKVTTQ